MKLSEILDYVAGTSRCLTNTQKKKSLIQQETYSIQVVSAILILNNKTCT